MERLSFADDASYDGFESSIHIARYLLAKGFCEGRKVLDVACGEGYGSRLLKDWGAAEVDGVDVSEEAVSRAQRNFGGEDVRFHCSPAEKLLDLFGEERFDLIVSLETIEHLGEPEVFLSQVRQLLRPGGCIVISCPNDWWYFPKQDEGNPYHLRKYHFEEFRQQAENVLGSASAWMLGAPAFGFLNTIRATCPEVGAGATQMAMMQTSALDTVHLVPAEFDAGPKDVNASYFVGIWTSKPALPGQTAALLPLSMDAFKKGVFQGHFSSAQEQLRQQLESALNENRRLHETVLQLRTQSAGSPNITTELRDARLRLQAAVTENQLMREKVTFLQNQLHLYQAAHDRYVRLRSVVPSRVRSSIVAARRLLRRFGV